MHGRAEAVPADLTRLIGAWGDLAPETRRRIVDTMESAARSDQDHRDRPV